MHISEWKRGEFVITTDRDRMNTDVIHRFLAQESMWARGIERATVEKSMRHSLCFGVFHGMQQVGFARVISDFAAIAYLGDVFVLNEYRGLGLAMWLMECVLAHAELQHLRRWILVTADAHGLYRKCGFQQLSRPDSFMEIHNPDVYKR
jgi:GNAT superfamily N-acetyltransferase